MNTLPIRLAPGQDLRRALEDALRQAQARAAFVLSGIGSLSEARLRFAGVSEPTGMSANLEMLTLAGSLSTAGAHLHATLADAQGRVVGGHVGYGCLVRTTAEVLIVLLDRWEFDRVPDAASGYDELVVRRTDLP
jgi:predicted DNA-binding protein with PD1-like motif